MDRAAQADRARNLVGAAVAFFGLVALALLIFAVTRMLGGANPLELVASLESLDHDEAMGRVSSAAEVVAGVLAIVITVVAIVIELAANRYTHRITQLFMREWTNRIVLGFFVLTTIICLWVSATAAPVDHEPVLPRAGLIVCMAMVTISLLMLLPYFAFLFRFVSPLNVITRIQHQAIHAIGRARMGGVRRARAEAIDAIEELEDIARGGDQADRSICMAAVEALADLVREYQPMRVDLSEAWYRLDARLMHDPDFVSMAPLVLEHLEKNKIWLETKVMRQYLALFNESLNRARDVANLIALQTRQLASSVGGQEPAFFDLALRFFNSYLRAAINVGDLRTAYYVLHQYRNLGEGCLDAGQLGRATDVAEFLRYYGQLGFGMGQPFLLEVVAYDLGLLVEHALEAEHPEADALLDLFLEVDREPDGLSSEHEERLRGVRRAQVQLAAYLLDRGDETRARRIHADMASEDPERLRAIRDEIEAETRAYYWEFTDRGVNFAYLTPERRRHLDQYFSWFDDPSLQRP
jgi:hypothetical protein